MRYIESTHGIILAPRRHVSHSDLAAGLDRAELLSAGFLASRYEADALWKTYGKSVGLKLESRPLAVLGKLWAGLHHRTVYFSDNPELLTHCTDVVEAYWGMSEEGWEGTCAVYTPLHPRFSLTADEILHD